MSGNSLKNELANHIYRYLCHEAQYSDLPEAARESLTAASECIEQAYKLNNNNSNNNKNSLFDSGGISGCGNGKSDILPDELYRIFSRHKESLQQQQQQQLQAAQPASSTTAASTSNTTTTAPPPTSSSSSSATATAAASTSKHSQHAISQLPMTTRKKLSHLRAQIKRQASKAARSTLEKRSSVSGVTSSSGHSGGPFSSLMGSSLDANNGTSKQQAGDCHNNLNTSDLCKDPANQPSSTSSMDSPNTHSNNISISSPAGTGINASSLAADQQAGSSNQFNSNLSSGQHNNETNTGNEAGTSGKHGKHGSHLIPDSHHHHRSIGVSVHQKNFKQKLIALIKKFRTDGSDFDSEEQYREALERELMKAAAGRGSRVIEELLEEDIDVEEGSGSETEDWDNISESSTPKPSLRPFFSSTTLDKM